MASRALQNLALNIIKNPCFEWGMRLAKNTLIEIKNEALTIKTSALVKDCRFGRFNRILSDAFVWKVTLGDYSYIGKRTTITHSIIGNYCSIGPDVSICMGIHPIDEMISSHPVFYAKRQIPGFNLVESTSFEEYGKVEIGSDVWVGARAIINSDVKIGHGAIIASGAVVTKDVPPYAIVGGVPARVIRYRFDESTVEELLKSKWWEKPIEELKDNLPLMKNIDEFVRYHANKD